MNFRMYLGRLSKRAISFFSQRAGPPFHEAVRDESVRICEQMARLTLHLEGGDGPYPLGEVDVPSP